MAPSTKVQESTSKNILPWLRPSRNSAKIGFASCQAGGTNRAARTLAHHSAAAGKQRLQFLGVLLPQLAVGKDANCQVLQCLVLWPQAWHSPGHVSMHVRDCCCWAPTRQEKLPSYHAHHPIHTAAVMHPHKNASEHDMQLKHLQICAHTDASSHHGHPTQTKVHTYRQHLQLHRSPWCRLAVTHLCIALTCQAHPHLRPPCVGLPPLLPGHASCRAALLPPNHQHWHHPLHHHASCAHPQPLQLLQRQP